MKVLVLNCGSSSLKFQLIETDAHRIETETEEVLAEGNVEKIGQSESIVGYATYKGDKIKENQVILDHAKAVEVIQEYLTKSKYAVIKNINEIEAVGHRVVHGGESFSESAVITPAVLEKIRECVDLAPLHNPPNILGYEVAARALPNVPHVAVFDTAFHQTMPDYAYLYALPYSLYEKHKVRRYGFHGTSHRYVINRLARLINQPIESFNAITVHVGNGCSMAAVRAGKCVDTTMGLTPLEGLVMGTRAGDIDPAIIQFIMDKEGLEIEQVNNMLNKFSGLIGISDLSNDMRELEDVIDTNSRARLAVDIFSYRIRKYIGAYAAVLGKVDHIIFTAGIGQHSDIVRARACSTLGDAIGAEIDLELNKGRNRKEGIISTENSKVKIWIIPTNEELVIARDTMQCVTK